MYTILANEVADVDKGLFRQIGRFNGVKAMPLTDQIFAIKSIRAHEIDSELNCQHSLFITLDANAMHNMFLKEEDWMEPGSLYERDKHYFVELRYDHPLGVVNLTMYFLVPIEDCQFYLRHIHTDGNWHSTTWDKLQETGNFIWVAQ